MMFHVERSSCSCAACRACCEHMPGALARLSDLERLEAATRAEGEDEMAWARRLLVASNGALLRIPSTGEELEIPTLALRSTGDDRARACAHYDSQAGRCGIYAARPAGCAEFRACETPDEHVDGIRRSLDMHAERHLARLEGGARYWRIWEVLAAEGRRRRRPELNARDEALRRAVDSLS